MSAKQKRRNVADTLADELVKLALVKGEEFTKRLDGGDAYAYAAGYIRSVLAVVASENPKALERLALTVRAARG